ncbi:MAG: amino acid ABC transporter permease [Pseudomonadota bacterium]
MDLRFFEIYRNPEYVQLLIEGAGLSIALTIAGGIAGFILAILLASARHFEVPFLAQISAAYVDFIRNTPLIVQLFFVTFGLPLMLGYAWPFWAHACLALVLNFSAYFAEIVRAGLASLPKGQSEAAMALGLPSRVVFLKVSLPQAIAAMYPSLNSQFIFLFLTTGIIAQIGVEDLTYAGLFIDSRTFRSFEVFITLTAMYVFIALGFKAALAQLHRLTFSWVGAR